MTLSSPDSNEIGRYQPTTSLNTQIHTLLNLALESVSAAFTKYVRTKTIFRRTTGTVASSSSFSALSLATSVVGSAWTHASGVFTCVTAGTYIITYTASVAANATGARGVRLVGSGSLGDRHVQLTAGISSTLPTTLTVAHMVTAAVNDTITAQVLQVSGASLTVVGEITFERIV